MSEPLAGNYPLERRAGEIERLLTQSQAMAPAARAMLDAIGVKPGWACLDIGCGPGGITSLLSERVGSSGRVIGLDRDPAFLAHARANAPPNVTFRHGNAFDADLSAGSFDLVHMRFVASTAGNPERLLQEAIRLARIGGIVALQEPDGSTLHCYPPHPAWERLKAALLGSFKGVGADLELASRLYFLAHEAGLSDIAYRTSLLAVRAVDPMVDYLPSTVESLRGTILKLGLMTAAELDATLTECRRHLSDSKCSFTMYAVAQVWGHRST